MKKSIYKVTAWSILIGVSIMAYIGKGTFTEKVGMLSSNQSQVSEVENNNQENYNSSNQIESTEQQSNSADYSSNSNTSLSGNKEIDFASNASSPVQSTTVADMGNNTTLNKEEFIHIVEPIANENAIAKGGPNNFGNNENLEPNNSKHSTNGIITSSASISTPTASARIAAPTIVTTPVNPSGGGSSGGSGAGDPYVPIDDYYGLIFLITCSTFIGIYNIKKLRFTN